MADARGSSCVEATEALGRVNRFSRSSVPSGLRFDGREARNFPAGALVSLSVEPLVGMVLVVG
jgi:hypothetical protein